MERSAVKLGLLLPLLYHRIPKTGIFVRKNGLFFPHFFRKFSAFFPQRGKETGKSFLLRFYYTTGFRKTEISSHLSLKFVSILSHRAAHRKYAANMCSIYLYYITGFQKPGFLSTFIPLIFHLFSTFIPPGQGGREIVSFIQFL